MNSMCILRRFGFFFPDMGLWPALWRQTRNQVFHKREKRKKGILETYIDDQ